MAPPDRPPAARSAGALHPAESVTAAAPCRVDLAGGTLDIWPLGLLHSNARTVNVAIDLMARATLRRKSAASSDGPRPTGYQVRQGDEELSAPDLAALRESAGGALVAVVAAALELPPLAVELSSDSPRGAGLGASSALTIALLAAGSALIGRPPGDAAAQAALARDLEARLMSLPTGTQDHYPALLGGALEVRHRAGGQQVERLEVDLELLAGSLLVVYSGRSHFSAGANWLIVRRRLEGDAEIVRLLDGIAEVAARLAVALAAGDLPRVGELMADEWALRRQLSDEVSTPALERLLARGAELGAWGGKACGAGGGGCVALLCPPERRAAIAAGLTAEGGQVLDTKPTAQGLRVERLG